MITATFALLSALFGQSLDSPAFTVVSDCAVAREVEVSSPSDPTGTSRVPGVIWDLNRTTGECRVGLVEGATFQGMSRAVWMPFSEVYPRSARVQTVVDQRIAADTASGILLPARLEAAKRLYLLSGPDKCHNSAGGIAAGPELAREVLQLCGYEPEQWDRATALGPVWDLTAMRAAAVQTNVESRARIDYANAVNAEFVRTQQLEAQAERDRQGPERTYATGNPGSPSGSTMPASTAGASTPATVSERELLENMARDACFANVRDC